MSWGRGEERKFLQNQVSLLPRSSPKQGPGLEAVDKTTVCFLVGEWLLDYPDCQIGTLTRAGVVWGAGQALSWYPLDGGHHAEPWIQRQDSNWCTSKASA